MMMIGEVFRGLNRFERMTEIYLDSEACNTLLKMSNQYNRLVGLGKIFYSVTFASEQFYSFTFQI